LFFDVFKLTQIKYPGKESCQLRDILAIDKLASSKSFGELTELSKFNRWFNPTFDVKTLYFLKSNIIICIVFTLAFIFLLNKPSIFKFGSLFTLL
jgi:hypothetical protein